MSAGTTVINKEYMEVVTQWGPLPTVYDINVEYLTDIAYHTRVADINIEYFGGIPYHTQVDDLNAEVITDTPYHTQVTGLFIEVIAAAPELSPQPVIPYFSLYFQT